MKKIGFALVSFLSMAWALAVVNINTATVQELQTLPNIGPAKANAIEEYRQAHGQFKTPADITKVKGIGQATYEKLKNEITVSIPVVKVPAKPRMAKPVYP